jgi:hypothetical protein
MTYPDDPLRRDRPDETAYPTAPPPTGEVTYVSPAETVPVSGAYVAPVETGTYVSPPVAPVTAPPASDPPSRSSQVKDTAKEQAADVKDTAKEQAAAVKQSAASAAQDVAGTAKQQAAQVAGTAADQARQVAGELRTQVNEQAGQQQQRAASGLRGLAQGLADMAEGKGAPSGQAQSLVREAADRLHLAAGRLEDRQPTELLDDVRAFARRRPGVFLLGAAAAGFLVGRMVKGAVSSGDDDEQPEPGSAAV